VQRKRTREGFLQGVDESVFVLGLDEEAVLSRMDHLSTATDIRNEGRESSSHGFEGASGKSLPAVMRRKRSCSTRSPGMSLQYPLK
jgi:hypothetical protein